MRHLDLFSGIGGFSIASDAVWKNVEHIFCDNEPFSQAVLKKHWPNSKIYGDIKELKGREIGTVDLVTGGFPCQPFSSAGKRLGTEDDRYLWPEMLRVIRETSPRWVIGENVSGLITKDGGLVLDKVCADLEAEAYEVWPVVIPACAINAPHRRDRVWIIAHAADIGDCERTGAVPRTNGGSKRINVPKLLNASTEDHGEDACTNAERNGIQGWTVDRSKGKEETRDEQLAGFLQFVFKDALSNAGTYRTSNGVSHRMDVRRNKALGNAIVPQVAAEIFKAIKSVDQ